MKNILIPTDFSDNAWNAIIYAIELFNRKECIFYLVNVLPITSYTGGEATVYVAPEILQESVLKENREKLKKLLGEIERLTDNPKHTFVSAALYGFFTDKIKQEVADKNIDLIIMGTKGASGIKAVSMGSNTGNVITKVSCAVLAIPAGARYSEPKAIGFPTDFQLGYTVNVLKQLKEVVMLYSSALKCLHVSTKKDELTMLQLKNRDFLRDYFKNTECSFGTLSEKKIDVAVQHFVESQNLDMIVMVAKNLNFLERILFRPRVEKISYHTTVPFLVLHE